MTVEWWEKFGAHVAFFDDTPALAADMAFHGPAEHVAYKLAYDLQNTAAQLDVYPQPGPEIPGGA